jgi:phospholipid/cholesterol/gamma-HCH transport system ATP-binding protein
VEPDVVIRVRGLTTRFGRQVVHDELDLDVRRGEIVGLVGGSGTGKSVLLREILGLHVPSGGSIEVFGQELGAVSADARHAIQARQGVLFQDGALFSSLTVCQNVQAPLRERFDLPVSLMEDLAGLKLQLVGLGLDAAPKYPAELSGGMRKRAGLARALALDPEILYLDEPTAGLDPIGAADFDRLIRRLQESLGLTVLMVTHDLDSLIAITDRVVALVDRQAVSGTVEALRKLDHPWLHEYFAGPRGRSASASAAEGSY